MNKCKVWDSFVSHAFTVATRLFWYSRRARFRNMYLKGEKTFYFLFIKLVASYSFIAEGMAHLFREKITDHYPFSHPRSYTVISNKKKTPCSSHIPPLAPLNNKQSLIIWWKVDRNAHRVCTDPSKFGWRVFQIQSHLIQYIGFASNEQYYKDLH